MWRVMTRATALVALGLLFALSVVFAVRRAWFAGADLTASGPATLTGALGIAVLVGILRLAWRESASGEVEHPSKGDWCWHALASVSLAVSGVTLATCAPDVLWGWAVLAVVLAEEGAVYEWLRRAGWWQSLGRRQSHGGQGVGTSAAGADSEGQAVTVSSTVAAAGGELAVAQPVRTPAAVAVSADVDADAESAELDEELETAWQPPGVTQQWTRGVEPAGGEYVEGLLYVDFVAGQRTETLHVAFCPPLANLPKIQLQPVDGPAVMASVGQVELFGARFEVRLAQGWDEPQRVVLQFRAQA